jgi:glycosyltransferase involved in cell wall biosynthesis
VPTVSIVLRTKNRPVLLARAFDSVLSQTFQDWQLTVVNDGGLPSAVEETLAPFIDRFAGRVHVVHHPISLGMEAASNRAIRDSSSTYIVIHDDDDTWYPAFLTKAVAFLEDEENAALGGVTAWSDLVEERLYGQDIQIVARRPYNDWLREVALSRLLAGNVFPPISFLFRRSVLDRVGLFDEALRVLGDWEFNVRFLGAADIGVIKEILASYHHRVSTDSDDTYSNSVHGAIEVHRRTNAALRNRLLRESLAAQPTELGIVASLSHDFVQLTERLNEVEAYLDAHSAGRVIERLNQVEDYLAGHIQRSSDRENAAIGRLMQLAADIDLALRPIRLLTWPIRRVLQLMGRG